jgi:hypothetical protein
LRYSPEPLSTDNDAQRTAYDFSALFSHVLCSTVTRARIRLIPLETAADWRDWRWTISDFDAYAQPVPFQLTDRTWLFAAQVLGVRESRRDGNLWLTTLAATYQWQALEDDGSWLVRWEYEREPSGSYPRSHVHVNATPASYEEGRKDFHKLHLPTGRIAIENIVSFLIREQELPPVSDRWDEVLDEAEGIFARIQGRERR